MKTAVNPAFVFDLSWEEVFHAEMEELRLAYVHFKMKAIADVV